MRLYIECEKCHSSGRVIVRLPCGCCTTTEECPKCHGRGFIHVSQRELDLIEKYGTCDQSELLAIAGKAYNAELHDEDSVFFNDSYVGPSERELGGGCNRCGGIDDCYCE